MSRCFEDSCMPAVTVPKKEKKLHQFTTWANVKKQCANYDNGKKNKPPMKCTLQTIPIVPRLSNS